MAGKRGMRRKGKKITFSRKLNVSQPVKTYVKKMISKKSEYKQIQSLSGTTGNPVALSNATWTQIGGLTAIGQGNGDNQRNGNTVNLRSVKMSFVVLFDGFSISAGQALNALDQAVRIVVFQFKKNATTAELALALNVGGTPFGITDDLANNENIKDLVYVLYDKTYHRFKDTCIGYGPANESGMIFNSRSITIKHQLKLKARTLKWNTATITQVEPDEQGAIYVYAFATQVNDSTATTMPSVLYHQLASQTNFMDM